MQTDALDLTGEAWTSTEQPVELLFQQTEPRGRQCAHLRVVKLSDYLTQLPATSNQLDENHLQAWILAAPKPEVSLFITNPTF